MYKNPKISVIIPVYNVEDYLKICLDSVINQTLKDIEILCIDDGSTDSSSQILKEYSKKDNRIIIFHQKNKGAGAARNIGLKYATGQYLHFMDSDDYIENNDFYEKLYNQITKKYAEICVCGLKKISDFSDNIEIIDVPTDYFQNGICSINTCPDNLLQISKSNVYTKLYKTSFIRQHKIKFQTTKTCNDIYFSYVSFALANRITYCDDVYIMYRYNRINNLSFSLSTGKNINGILINVKRILRRYKIENVYNIIRNSFYSCCIAHFNYELNNCNIYKKKIKFIKKCIEFLPSDFIEQFCQTIKVKSNYRKENIFYYIQYNYRKFFYINKGAIPLRIFSVSKFQNYTQVCVMGIIISIFKNTNEFKIYHSKDREKIYKLREELQSLKDDIQKELNNIVERDFYKLPCIDEKYIVSKIAAFNGYGLNTEEQRDKKLIVSLTSSPERITNLQYTLFSLLKQNLKPDKIILYLAKSHFPNCEDDINENILNYKQFGLEIRFCDENIEDYKKTIPALKDFPKDIVVTLDDSIYYDSACLERLYNNYKNSDKKTIISNICDRVAIKDYDILFHKKWETSHNITDASYLNLPVGYGGILYPPEIFNKDFFDEDAFMTLAPQADDVWFWSMAILNGVKIKNIAAPVSLCKRLREELNDRNNYVLSYLHSEEDIDTSIANVLDKYPEIMDSLNKTHIKVSVIVPVYNASQYLRTCLDSLQRQTLQEIEIICINDGSTDKSPEILKEYSKKDSRIKIVDISHSGPSAARNAGLKLATGEYVGFVDSDDFIDDTYYEKLYNKAFSSNADIARCTYKYFYPDKITEGELNNLIRTLEENNEYLNANEHSVVIWNAIYNLNFLKRNNIDYFDEDLLFSEDISFTERVNFTATKIIPVSEIYYYAQIKSYQIQPTPIQKLNYVFRANKYAADFINSLSEVISKEDYLTAYNRILNRYKDIYNQYSEFTLFAKKAQEKFADEGTEVYSRCKYLSELNKKEKVNA